MRKIFGLSLAFGLALIGGRVSATDYWDANPITNDNGMGTTNELTHGTSQQHDLQVGAGPAADQDWYRVISQPWHSYEVVIDSVAGPLNMNTPPHFQRLNASGAVLQSSEGVTPGFAFTFAAAMRWADAGAYQDQYIRVQSLDCGLTCGPNDQYHIRFYETTVSVPRFNNASGQVTILVIKNNTDWIRPITGTIYFWGANGFTLNSQTFTLGQEQALVLNTTTIAGVQGASGTITVAHDGGYGNLAMKSVALDPATGFSFDTPGTYKPH